ncbi:immunity 22 family protein [Winogradskyella sp. 3972H.M.0a.05]|uniref:immunity 22 family protein n=1 Tax=Winogradskyella sp. 3972H.M.0a.05 TaxID=2950277 RepID=UPI0033943D44
MEQQNKVSLWVGTVASRSRLNEIMQEVYDDEGDVSSQFMEVFKIDYIDNQFQEVYFYENLASKEEAFNGFSYSESFINHIQETNWAEKNSLILLYNFEYDGNTKSGLGLEFIGVFNFSEDQ